MNTIKNSVQLIGRLGKDIETIELKNGRAIAKASIATNDFYTNKDGERVENTHWHQLVAYGKTAEYMSRLLQKGTEVAIKGKLNHRSYEDKKGITRYVSEVVVDQFNRFGKASELPF